MSETTHSPSEVAKLLGLTEAMVRRYSDAMEAVTGVKVAREARGGRVYSASELRVLVAARALLEATTTHLSIDSALRRVLGTEAVVSSVGEGAGVVALIFEKLNAQTAMIAALQATVTALGEDVQALRETITNQQS